MPEKTIGLGEKAPDFKLKDQDGLERKLTPLPAAQWTALAFYPKASTPGCTKEVCSIRDAAKDLAAAGIRVFGVSTDDVGAQKKFHAEQKLNFPLLADPEGEVTAKYAGFREGSKNAQRVTVLIDPKGVVRHIEREVKTDTHGGDLVKLLNSLGA